MILLEQLYDIEFSKINFLERKRTIDYNKTIIVGPPKSGKSYLIYDYLSQYDGKDYLYIDFYDYKVVKDDIVKYLDSFILEHTIKVLVLENIDFKIDLPDVESIIITSKSDILFDGFKILELMPLDFEEFILFDSKHQNIVNSFNTFLKYGNTPEIVEYSDIKKQKRNYEICKLYTKSEVDLDILLLMIKSISQKKSIFQLYNQLKKSVKISKDRFYATVDKFVADKVVFFCEKFNQPRATKKIYIFNYALVDIVTYQKNFNSIFNNMIFLELYYKYNKDIYFLDNIDFYIASRKMVVLSIPFFDDFLWNKLASVLLKVINEYEIKSIYIITISKEDTIYLEDMEVSILPFYDWVLGE